MDNRPGFFTGSGMPMRFADLDGTMIDVYQATTQMTDESGQTYPFTIDTLLDRALGAEGYYGAFTANIHTDGSTEQPGGGDRRLGQGARRPRRLGEADAHLARRPQRLVVHVDRLERRRAELRRRRRARAPTGCRRWCRRGRRRSPLTALTRGGAAVPFTTQTIKGIEYAVFAAAAGTYQATYTVDTTPPVISNVSASVGTNGTATVQWATDEPATSVVAVRHVTR